MLIIRVPMLLALFALLALIPGHSWAGPGLAAPAIVINLPSRTLELFSGNTLIRVYPVAIGKPLTPTPLGRFFVLEKEVNPIWVPPHGGEPVPSGPHNPLGYRWLGFAPTYGMHGTNAPWTIGLAVSNGCIRLYEEDIEELFEFVPCGTPIRVTYDRIKVRIDEKGEASIGIYPDVYGYKTVTLPDVKLSLAPCGLTGLLTDGEILRLIDDEPDRQVVFAKLHKIRLNGQPLPDQAITIKNSVSVPVWAVAGALGKGISWDEKKQVVKGPKGIGPGVIKGERIYVAAVDLPALFGGQTNWRPEENILEINVLTVVLNGKTIAGDAQEVGGIMAIPLLPLAEALGHKVTRTPDNAFWLQGKQLPAIFHAGRPYIQLTKIFEIFQAYVYWNQPAWTIELTYPYTVKGGND